MEVFKERLAKSIEYVESEVVQSKIELINAIQNDEYGNLWELFSNYMTSITYLSTVKELPKILDE